MESLYSGTSLKGLSKLRTQYKTLPIMDMFCSPNGTMLIHFYSERGKPLYNSNNDPEMAGPKVSIISSTVPSSAISRELLLADSY